MLAFIIRIYIYMNCKHINIYSVYQNLLQKIFFIYKRFYLFLLVYSAFQNTL